MQACSRQTHRTDTGSSTVPTSVHFGADNFDLASTQKGRKRVSTSKCLLIGFDTEYQTFGAVDREGIERGEAHNEVLSYQFSVKLIAQEAAAEAAPEVDGIIIPEAGERMSMEDFLAFALGSLVAKYPLIVLPATIYLIGHFTRADLPAFEEFSNNAKQLLSNVRNTLVSIDTYIPFDLIEETQTEIASFKVYLRDTLLLAPSNAKSLADVGEIVGLPKINLHEDRSQELEIKKHMKDFRTSDWERFREYAIRDAQVCVRYADHVIRQYQTLFNEFKMPITLTQFGTRLVMDEWKKAEWGADTLLGREPVKERSFSKKLGYSIERTTHPFIEGVFYEASFVTETYHGGRNEQFAFGIAEEGEWRDHDLSSAYTTAMSLIGTPCWTEIVQLTEFNEVGPTDLSFFSVDFEFPKSVKFPTLPVRTPNGIIFPRKGRALCCAPEVRLAQKLGANLTFRRGIRVPTDSTKPIFKGFIAKAILERGKHPKGSFGNLFWKEVGNSTYGKTAQGLREKRVYDLRADDMVALPESSITQPFFASFITSFTRAVLGEILNGFRASTRVFSVTTDGFLSDASDAELNVACEGELFQTFANARLALDPKSVPIEVKRRIAQPIGWRTRGSATLKAGPDTSSSIVLQKGGIKTDSLFDLEEQNHFVIDLFLNRLPEQRLEYTVGIGLKDMIRFETDFVSRSVTKRLSMEFDWKRKPIAARDTTVEFEGKSYTHLSFDTEPHSDFDSFQRYRDAWETYDKKPRQNLKTTQDFDRFMTFLETRRHPDHELLLYLRKEDGDLKRLRRDLCLAFVHHQAGFDLSPDLSKIGYREFAERLTECGIPCRVSDLDNAKRKIFTPRMTLSTPRVLTAIRMLKMRRFQDLITGNIIANEEDHLIKDSSNP